MPISRNQSVKTYACFVILLVESGTAAWCICCQPSDKTVVALVARQDTPLSHI
ncbi:predicted protein [Sclerotinia sclerotiorum 1980 UF-70]|uniref:Secreted protein n=2 Tax=Sclerotinia sclerotiorum (strain ATCC 18683 / 1980 / Ss-1) TaxID=665079 RepID=A7F3T2_SCLS1|nr:predicted protein [Sclerotinia sclerotiorum 1980 UF-70]APA14268.1 hypothetical protein sscle_12g090380 [Sclerotinia sclerotiorum 1980 UF-70]EDN97403.1 predicted protein [Sclerotinia sclerotiorum 1980 UF-70]